MSCIISSFLFNLMVETIFTHYVFFPFESYGVTAHHIATTRTLLYVIYLFCYKKFKYNLFLLNVIFYDSHGYENQIAIKIVDLLLQKTISHAQ